MKESKCTEDEEKEPEAVPTRVEEAHFFDNKKLSRLLSTKEINAKK